MRAFEELASLKQKIRKVNIGVFIQELDAFLHKQGFKSISLEISSLDVKWTTLQKERGQNLLTRDEFLLRKSQLRENLSNILDEVEKVMATQNDAAVKKVVVEFDEAQVLNKEVRQFFQNIPLLLQLTPAEVRLETKSGTSYFDLNAEEILVEEAYHNYGSSLEVVPVNDKPTPNRDTWYLECAFFGNELPAPEATQLLWTMSQVLGQIEGLHMAIDDWRRGSFIIRYKLRVFGQQAKKAVFYLLVQLRDVIDGLKAKALGDFTKPQQAKALTKKAEAEQKQIATATQKLEKEIAALPNEATTSEMQQLELQKKRLELENLQETQAFLRAKRKLELEQLQLDNDAKRLQNQQSAAQLLGEALQNCPVDFELKLNGLLLSEKKQHQLNNGVDLESIANSLGVDYAEAMRQIGHPPADENDLPDS